LAPVVQEDIKALFGNQQAGAIADQMLLVWAILTSLSAAAKTARWVKAAKFFINSRLCFRSLDPMLRLYEGCANRTIGRLREPPIKFHTKTPKISYLFTLTLILIPIPPCTPDAD